MADHEQNEEICCPRFEPEPWDNKVIEWDNKLFVRDKVRTFFYMPFGFGKVMVRLDEKIRKAEGQVPDWLCLSDHTSKWNMDVYLAVNKKIPDLENVTISGKYFSKVYEGPFKDTDKWCKNFKELASKNNYNLKKWYMWYTTCPKCAKKYGKNYVVLIGELS